MTDIDSRISQANGRLKFARVGVSLERRGNRLCLRATFPPKPGSRQTRKHRQRLYLGCHASTPGLKEAELEARKIGALLDCKEFSWEPYLKIPAGNSSECASVVARFKEVYFHERRNRDKYKVETTWKTDYESVFKNLPPLSELTPELLREVIEKSEPGSKTRKRYCMALSYLARFAGVELETKRLSGNYGLKSLTPRDIPSDKLIAEWFFKIESEPWQWFYGMMAVYGLRNHEVFHLDLEQLREKNRILTVTAGKTGYRRVWPCYPEWVDHFDLLNIKIPQIKMERSNSEIGNTATHHFGKFLPFRLYDLRHAWAVRTLNFGLDITLAAQQMGHSIEVHSKTYHRWISDQHHQRAFDIIMQRSDRPLPPKI
ncbi:MAG: site-specific integrase [Nostocaceae cyanobacterium]|nr:site-specific integrase [Nostocaceae cyanobacterium]